MSAVTCCGVTNSGASVVSSAGSFLARRHQRRQIGIGHRPDQFRIVRAFAGDGEVWPFEMQPGKAGHLAPRRLDAGGDRGSSDFRRVGDQRRQQRGGAEGRMRPADRLDALDIWMIVEHDAAAAIDLQVDKAGGEHVAGVDGFRAFRNFPARNDRLDDAAANDQRGVLMPGFAVEDALGGKGEDARS